MSETVWEFPVPATRIERKTFVQNPRRECVLTLETDEQMKFVITFHGVEAYRCTYMASMTADMIDTAYGKLVRLEAATWLNQIAYSYNQYHSHTKEVTKELQHLMICFDDGPCYEVICAGVDLPT